MGRGRIKMKQTKYVMSGGLAFDEERDMKRLASLAQKGWLFEKFSPMGYTLRKGEPAHLQYAIDYRKKPDRDYFAYFEEAGWTHEGSAGDSIHLFSAPEDVAPIYSDTETMVEKYRSEQRLMGKSAVVALLFTLVLWWMSQWGIGGLAEGVVSILLVLSLIALVFTGLPYLGYTFKLSKLQK